MTLAKQAYALIARLGAVQRAALEANDWARSDRVSVILDKAIRRYVRRIDRVMGEPVDAQKEAA